MPLMAPRILSVCLIVLSQRLAALLLPNTQLLIPAIQRLSCVMSQAHTSSHLQGRESDQLRPCQTATSGQRSCSQSLVPRYKQILKTILCVFVYEKKDCEEVEQLLENGEYHCNVERGLYSL